MQPSILEQLKGVLFHLFPHHLVSRITYWLSRIQTPLAQPIMRLYVRAFGVDMTDAEQPDLENYACFNDFFTRSLKPDARPICRDENTLISPCDGTFITAGRITDGQLIQAKNLEYSAHQLLGNHDIASKFQNGCFCTLYLSPADYHRVHMPVAGTLRHMIHIPGRLFSVANYAWSVIPRLAARNERVVNIFGTERGLLAVVMVGAVNVGCIETAWHGIVAPKHASWSQTDYLASPDQLSPTPKILSAGDEVGRFNLGSTVIVLLEEQNFSWKEDVALAGNTVKMGSAIGQFVS